MKKLCCNPYHQFLGHQIFQCLKKQQQNELYIGYYDVTKKVIFEKMSMDYGPFSIQVSMYYCLSLLPNQAKEKSFISSLMAF